MAELREAYPDRPLSIPRCSSDYLLGVRLICEPGANDNIRSGAADDCFQFSLLLGGNCELIQCLLKIVQERLPLLAGNFQVGMRVRHRPASVFLWAARSPADHLSHQVLESRRWHAMMRFVYQGIGIQSRVCHDSVDEIVYDCRNAIHATESVVEEGFSAD